MVDMLSDRFEVELRIAVAEGVLSRMLSTVWASQAALAQQLGQVTVPSWQEAPRTRTSGSRLVTSARPGPRFNARAGRVRARSCSAGALGSSSAGSPSGLARCAGAARRPGARPGPGRAGPKNTAAESARQDFADALSANHTLSKLWASQTALAQQLAALR